MTKMRLRDPSPKVIRDSEMKSRPKTRLQDPAATTLPRYRDGAKIFRDPRFPKYHSMPLVKE